jgi:hypothetical protein
MPVSLTPAEVFRQGVLACRAQKWREGLDLLTTLAQKSERQGNLPGLFYSFLGVAMARCEGRRQEGMQLCRYAVSVQPEEPDNHLNLALLYVMVGRRQAAIRALEDGLELQPNHPRLMELLRHLGIRRRPPLPFLPRTNPANVLLGQVRHRLLSLIEERRARRREELELEQP